jgi:hypothetical protein
MTPKHSTRLRTIMKTTLSALAIFGMTSLATLSTTKAEDNMFKQTTNAAEHIAIIDALHRFTWGMDTDDGALIASAFAEKGVADFSPAAKRIGITFPPLEGRDTIQKALTPFAEGLITSHTVGNARVEINGNQATLRALVEAQQIAKANTSRFILLKNDYQVDLVKEGDTWLITRMTIDNIWSQGDAKVLTGE